MNQSKLEVIDSAILHVYGKMNLPKENPSAVFSIAFNHLAVCSKIEWETAKVWALEIAQAFVPEFVL